MGKKSGGSSGGGSPYEETMAGISRKIFEETEPYRKQWYDIFDQASQGIGPLQMPIYAGMRAPVEAQYNVARENTLASTPAGGALIEALANIEAERAAQLSDITGNLQSDIMNKMFGLSTGAPSIAIEGLGRAAQGGTARYSARQSADAARYGSTVGGLCCFNFLAAEGEIYPSVRRYRDEHYSKDGAVSRGYVRTSLVLVPLMGRYRWFKALVRYTMTKPLRNYADWSYGLNSWGFLAYPAKLFWTGLWRALGCR